MVAGQLEIQMLANMARLADDMNKAKGMVGGAMKGIEGAVASAKTALGALGIGLGAGYFVSLIKGSIDAMDHLNDLSKKTSIAVEQLAGLKLAAKQSGGDLDSIAQSINKLSQNMGKDAEKFKALGISAKDPLEAFKQLSDLFVQIQNPQQRAAVMAAALGKSWAGAAPLLAEGGRRIGEIVEEGSRLSGVARDNAEQADRFNDQLAILNTTMGATRTRLVSDMLPGLNDIATAMREAAKEGGLLLTIWVALGGAMANLLGMTEAQKTAKRLREIADELDAARKRLQAGSTNPAGANPHLFSFLVPDIKVGEVGLAKLRATIAALEEEKKRLTPADKAAPPGVDPKVAAAAAARAAAFLDEGKEAKDLDATYRGLLKTLQEKLLADREHTEVAKLQLALDALSAKQLATITPEREAELKTLATKVDLMKQEKEAAENNGKNEEALMKMRAEGAEIEAAATLKRGEALIQGYENARQIEFEAKLIGMANLEREKAIALRALETSGIRQTDEAYAALAGRVKAALEQKDAAQAAADLKKKSLDEWHNLWSTVESTGKTVFMNVFADGKSAFEGIGKAIKASVIDLLYQITLKKWIIQIGTSITGSLGMTAANAATGGGFGGVNPMSLFSSGSQGVLASGASMGAFGEAAALTAATEAAALGGSGATLAMAGGAMAGIGAAIPWVGAALAVGSMLGMFGGDGEDRTASPQGSGLRFDSTISRGGFSGLVNTIAGSSPSDLWAGSSDSALPAAQLASFNAAIAQIFSGAEGAAKQLGISSAALDSIMVQIEDHDWNGVEAGMQKALQKTADTIALTLMPSITGLQQAGESLAQTFARLAAENAAAQEAMENERIAAIRSAVDVLHASYQREADELEQMAAKWHAAAASLRAYGATLVGIGAGGMSYAAAARQFASTAAQARLGDLGAIGNLQGVSETFRTASLAGSASGLAYARDVARIQAVVGQTADLADRQASVALEQRDILTTQAEQLIDINDSVVTVGDAIVFLQAQIEQLRQTTDASGKHSKRTADILEAVTHGQLELAVAA